MRGVASERAGPVGGQWKQEEEEEEEGRGGRKGRRSEGQRRWGEGRDEEQEEVWQRKRRKIIDGSVAVSSCHSE